MLTHGLQNVRGAATLRKVLAKLTDEVDVDGSIRVFEQGFTHLKMTENPAASTPAIVQFHIVQKMNRSASAAERTD